MNIITPSLLNAIYEQPWNITGAAWRSIHNALSAGTPQDLDLSSFFTARKPLAIDDNNIAHISVSGILGEHQGSIAGVLGDTDYGVLGDEIQHANDTADGALFHHDSPGGQTTGNLEVAELVAGMDIPTASYCKGMMCSASYKIAAGSDYLAASPSSMVGSISTIIPFVDQSGLWDQMGLKPDYITSGTLKGAGMPPSLSDEHRASLQEMVTDLGDSFKSHVTAHRAISDEYMQGQAFIAPRALTNNLIDKVGSVEDAYSYLMAPTR